MREFVHPVAKLILSRRAAGSTPQNRNDGRRIALAIEGGGMRGVISAGMVAALEQLGLRDSFDCVYGCSAGAVSAAYFVAGQARYGTTIFYDNINNRKFIDLRRLLWRRPVLSLEFLLDHVCVREKPLAFGAVLSSDVPLFVVSSSVTRKKSVVLKDFVDGASLLSALRGSARMPFFAGPPVEHAGDRLLDASIYQYIPFSSAVNDGATDVVVLLSRPAGVLRGKPGLMEHLLVVPYLQRLDPELASHYLGRAEQYRRELETIRRHNSGGLDVGCLPIQVDANAADISPFERDRARLLRSAMNGFQATYRALGLPVPELVEIITPIIGTPG
jgi:predicted patatin/cPLA2 family phospholipase